MMPADYFTTAIFPLLAQAGQETYSLSWFVVLFCVILGLLVTLTPSRRTTEFRRVKEQ